MTAWPGLALSEWRDTRETLHRWTQIPGKILLARTPLVNHFWNAAFHSTPVGWTTGAMPRPDGDGSFSIDFDLEGHAIGIRTSGGDSRSIPLAPQAVADFHRRLVDELASLGIRQPIWTMPVEIENPIRFEEDRVHASYDRDFVSRFHRAISSIERVFVDFRAGFLGKCSPVHFFWGSFDLCVTRFSGRPAPERPGADRTTKEAYSHEVSSVGFWPGGGPVAEPSFYAYAAPEPDGYRDAPVRPAAAYYHPDLKEFLLPYEAVRTAKSPESDLRAFCESTYAAAAELGKWDRGKLEREK